MLHNHDMRCIINICKVAIHKTGVGFNLLSDGRVPAGSAVDLIKLVF